MISQIPSDDLGEWAEKQFESLGAAGGLVINKASRDKMGWDYLVELPPAADDAETLDQRQNALRCRIQIKAHWSRDSARAVLSLSAAERLAKDPGPAFLLIMTAEPGKGEDDPTLSACHLVHFQGDILARLLKRLREVQVEPAPKSLSEIAFTVASSAGDALSPSGKRLKALLKTACGSDIGAYIAAKTEALKSLGYEPGRYQVKATIQAGSLDELVEVMLGERQADIEILEASDIRFGIAAPMTGSAGKIGQATRALIKPRPAGTCRIRVRGAATLEAPATFAGEVILPPTPADLPDENRRMKCVSEFFTLDLKGTGEVGFTLRIAKLQAAQLAPEGWRHHLRLLEILSEKQATFEITGDAPGTPRDTITLDSISPLPEQAWLPLAVKTVKKGQDLLRMAGELGEPEPLQTVLDSAEEVDLAYACMFAPETFPAQEFSVPVSAVTAEPGDLDFLLASYVRFGGKAMAYCAKTTYRPEPAGDSTLFRHVEMRPLALSTITATEEAFRAFVDQSAAMHGLENRMVRAPESSEGDGEEEQER